MMENCRTTLSLQVVVDCAGYSATTGSAAATKFKQMTGKLRDAKIFSRAPRCGYTP